MDKKHTRSLSGGRGNTNSQSNEELTIASPAEFVQRFGGNRVIEKVRKYAPCTIIDIVRISMAQCSRALIHLGIHKL